MRLLLVEKSPGQGVKMQGSVSVALPTQSAPMG
jgi:hypothetical protein